MNLKKIDIRVGKISPVDDVPRSDRPLQLKVSFGDHWPTIYAA